MYLLALSLTGSRPAAAVAGVLFVFVPFRAQEAGHLQSLMYGWMPIGLWALHRYFATGRQHRPRRFRRRLPAGRAVERTLLLLLRAGRGDRGGP